ncbi:hypothetical protein M407DRAFT_133700 [Tulasnella calospora MUT 4182]|uniref:Uncharacterized protein n=1 Tax=Tulasnella calospora MUT 4182 TaxID=1051891 RepID=A0A0C3MCK0_9AGAM|nr:hypothetical protein M407DRAFT_133700 [Tulasnella calospora MUT 4182]
MAYTNVLEVGTRSLCLLFFSSSSRQVSILTICYSNRYQSQHSTSMHSKSPPDIPTSTNDYRSHSHRQPATIFKYIQKKFHLDSFFSSMIALLTEFTQVNHYPTPFFFI